MRKLPTTSNDDHDVSGSFGKIEKCWSGRLESEGDLFSMLCTFIFWLTQWYSVYLHLPIY